VQFTQAMKTRLLILALAGPAALCSAPPGRAAGAPEIIAESRFEEDVDGAHGWTGITVAGWDAAIQNRSPSRRTNDGVDGRYLRLAESGGDGRAMYFSAPTNYLGDRRTAYGGRLEYHLRQLATEGLGAEYAVILHSGGSRLIFHSGRMPDLEWRRYVVPLHESGAWFNDTTRERATRDELVAVLANLTRLSIRAEYNHHGGDEAHLDNVVLLGPASGPAVPELAAARYTGITIAGEVGRTYRIEATAALAEPPVWQAVTNLVLPGSPFFWLDPDSAQAAPRFYRAVRVD
jgi:Laminin B (Domain IV)